MHERSSKYHTNRGSSEHQNIDYPRSQLHIPGVPGPFLRSLVPPLMAIASRGRLRPARVLQELRGHAARTAKHRASDPSDAHAAPRGGGGRASFVDPLRSILHSSDTRSPSSYGVPLVFVYTSRVVTGRVVPNRLKNETGGDRILDGCVW